MCRTSRANVGSSVSAENPSTSFTMTTIAMSGDEPIAQDQRHRTPEARNEPRRGVRAARGAAADQQRHGGQRHDATGDEERRLDTGEIEDDPADHGADDAGDVAGEVAQGNRVGGARDAGKVERIGLAGCTADRVDEPEAEAQQDELGDAELARAREPGDRDERRGGGRVREDQRVTPVEAVHETASRDSEQQGWNQTRCKRGADREGRIGDLESDPADRDEADGVAERLRGTAQPEGGVARDPERGKGRAREEGGTRARTEAARGHGLLPLVRARRSSTPAALPGAFCGHA